MERSKLGILARFMDLAKEWTKDTQGVKGTEKYFNRNYIKIVDMGDDVIPIILDQIVKDLLDEDGDPSQWFWALRLIIGENPVPERFRNSPKKAASCWLHWGNEHGFETKRPGR